MTNFLSGEEGGGEDDLYNFLIRVEEPSGQERMILCALYWLASLWTKVTSVKSTPLLRYPWCMYALKD